MKKLLARFARQSPALIVAMIALFVALTGTAVATTSALITGNQIKNNSITGLDVRNRSLRPIDFRGSVRGPRGPRGLRGLTGATGTAGAKGDKGDKGDPGPGARWALVAGDGTIVAQSGGITLFSHPFSGEYILEFGTPVTGKAILVTPSGRDNAFSGAVWGAPCGPPPEGYPNCAGQPNTRLHVLIMNQANTATANHSFYVAVIT